MLSIGIKQSLQRDPPVLQNVAKETRNKILAQFSKKQGIEKGIRLLHE